MEANHAARIFARLATLLEIQGENPFKIRAYKNAARALEGMTEPLETLVADGRIGEVKGIGKAIEDKLGALVETGTFPLWDRIREAVPDGVADMTDIPGIGPKKVRRIWEELGVETFEDLKRACDEGRVAAIQGFGKRTEKTILDGLAFLEKVSDRVLLGDAVVGARALLAHVRDSPDVVRANLAGSIRRGRETIGDIDIVASSDEPERVMEHFLAAPGVEDVLVRGSTKTSVRIAGGIAGGIQVDLRVVSDDVYPSCLAHFTGSKEHNVAMRQRALTRGYSISEYGIKPEGGGDTVTVEDEAALYAFFDLDYIPPEMRENRGEIEAAEEGALPTLLLPTDLKGIVHCHTTWSDGKADLPTMVARARDLGYGYIAITDHSKAASYANGLDEECLRQQGEEIDALNASDEFEEIEILKGIEVDILADGALDLDDDTLGALDFVIASVHTRMSMSTKDMTARIVRAIEHPLVDCIAHPTGRRLLQRQGFTFDVETVFEAAARCGTFLEINAHPRRLDLDPFMARRAAEAGVLLLIGPDAHQPSAIENVGYGIVVARRAWLGQKHIANARRAPEFRKALSRNRP